MQAGHFRTSITAAVISASLLTISAPALADSFDKGERAFQRGDYAEAIRLFSKSARPEAPFRMGEMAEKGNVPNCDLNCALQWYLKSADAGNLDAIPSVGVLYWNDRQIEKALNVFRFGARWIEPASRDFLQSQGEAVPAPDLWNAHVAQLQAEQAKRQQQQDLAANLLGSFFAGYYGSAVAPPAPQPGVQTASPAPQAARHHGHNRRLQHASVLTAATYTAQNAG